MRTSETSGNRRKASDGRELREFWTRAKRHMSRRDFEKLRSAAIVRQYDRTAELTRLFPLSDAHTGERERARKNTIESKKEKNMAETAQTMTEFTYAPGEKNIVGDRFSPSVIIFWLKTSIAASSTRVQYKAPNTLFGLIPLGASTKTIPLRNIASVDTNTRFNLGSLVWGLIFLFVGFGMFNSNALVAIVCLLVAVANFANVMSATLTFHDPSGGANAITVSILEQDKLMSLAQEIQARVSTDADQLRHEESMHMAEKQYTAQTNSVLIQQQMLANQQAQAAQPASVQTLAQAEQTQPSE